MIIINEDFFDEIDIDTALSEPADVKFNEHFDFTHIINLHIYICPSEQYSTLSGFKNNPEKMNRIGRSLRFFEKTLFHCFDSLGLEHSEHFELCSRDFMTQNKEKTQSYKFGNYVLIAEPDEKIATVFFICGINISDMPLKTFSRFYTLVGNSTAHLYNYPNGPQIFVTGIYKNNENGSSDNKLHLKYEDIIGYLSKDGQIRPSKEVFFESIQKLYPTATYFDWLNVCKNDNKPSDALYFETDIIDDIKHGRGGTKDIIKIDYIENPDICFEKNKGKMIANLYELSYYYTLRKNVYSIKSEAKQIKKSFCFPELNHRNFTLFCVKYYNRFSLFLFFDGTVFKDNKEYTISFEISDFLFHSKNLISEIQTKRYLQPITKILHFIYNNSDKELDALTKII